MFEPAALLREARRQKGYHSPMFPHSAFLIPMAISFSVASRVPARQAVRHVAVLSHRTLRIYACRRTAGIIGCAVGAPFAVLVAEELFACGCRMVISVTSAGQIEPVGDLPYFRRDRSRVAGRGHELSLRPAGGLCGGRSSQWRPPCGSDGQGITRPRQGRAGRPTHRSAKRRALSPLRAPKAC